MYIMKAYRIIFWCKKRNLSYYWSQKKPLALLKTFNNSGKILKSTEICKMRRVFTAINYGINYRSWV